MFTGGQAMTAELKVFVDPAMIGQGIAK